MRPFTKQTPNLLGKGQARRRDQNLVYYVDEGRPIIMSKELYREKGRVHIKVNVYASSGIDLGQALISSAKHLSSSDDPFLWTCGQVEDMLYYKVTEFYYG
jgi:hypothetical protein